MNTYTLVSRSRIRVHSAFFIGLALSVYALMGLMPAHAQSLQVWWPTNNVTVQGVQPIKAMVQGTPIEQYRMYWRVGDGQKTEMWNDYRDYPHKEGSIDFSNWTWLGAGPYVITLTAADYSGRTIAETSVSVYVPQPYAPREDAPTVTSIATSTLTAAPDLKRNEKPKLTASANVSTNVSTTNASKLYIDPASNAARQATAWRTSKPYEAGLMDILAAQPAAQWFGGWNADIRADAKKLVDAAEAQGAMPVMIAYNVPHRDCGGYSAGGTAHADAYREWIRGMKEGIGSRAAIVVLEPDALASMGCLSDAQKNERMNLLSEAVDTLESNGKTDVYVDAGHSAWVPAQDMAGRLIQAGVSKAAGFALNVSNFRTTEESESYGEQVSAAIRAATGVTPKYVIDTARNGQGPNGSEWCNPSGRGLGRTPTLSTGKERVAGYLWLKAPGESDGNCNGGPNAGVWWPEYAVGLVERRVQ